MMGIIEAAQRMRDRVDGAKSALERRGAHRRGNQHIAARIEIAALLHHFGQILLDEPHAF